MSGGLEIASAVAPAAPPTRFLGSNGRRTCCIADNVTRHALPCLHTSMRRCPVEARALSCSAQAFGLPPLTPHAVRCNAAEGTVEVTYGELTSTRVFMLRAEAVGAILIAYCNRAGMPMPRAADKGVRIERDHVVVVLTLRIAGTPPPEVPESTITRVPEAVRAWSWIEMEH
jgi:hypothetical protein